MRTERLRVGFIGASSVAKRVWIAIHNVGHTVTCIGCRDATKGEQLIQNVRKEIEAADKKREADGQGPQPLFFAPAVGSYLDVVRSEEVDVVYISIPTASRSAWIRMCADYGKHVVSEKPAATSVAELAECLEAMTAQRLLFVDGTTLTHGQRLQDVRRAVAQLGGPQHINTHMSFCASPAFLASDIRMQPQLEPHGALGDLGWYCIRWILHLVDFALPTGVTGCVTECAAMGEKKEAVTEREPPKMEAVAEGSAASPQSAKQLPAITGFEGSLEFVVPSAAVADSNATAPHEVVTACFQCSFHQCHDQTVEVFCRDGTVTIHTAINPTAEDRPRFHVERTRRAVDPPPATKRDGSGADAKEAYQVYEHVEEATEEVVVYSTAPDEVDGTYQMEQLWRHVGEGVMQLGKGEPLIANADLAKKWSTFAFVTQAVMDRSLEAASQRAMAATPASRSEAEPQS